jgi:hypothetical protein
MKVIGSPSQPPTDQPQDRKTPIAESPPNPTIQVFNSQPTFPLSYLGEMSVDQRGSNRKPLSRLPQRGEAKALLKRNYILANRHNHQPTSLLPIWEGRGIGPSSLPRLESNFENRVKYDHEIRVGSR